MSPCLGHGCTRLVVRKSRPPRIACVFTPWLGCFARPRWNTRCAYYIRPSPLIPLRHQPVRFPTPQRLRQLPRAVSSCLVGSQRLVRRHHVLPRADAASEGAPRLICLTNTRIRAHDAIQGFKQIGFAPQDRPVYPSPCPLNELAIQQMPASITPIARQSGCTESFMAPWHRRGNGIATARTLGTGVNDVLRTIAQDNDCIDTDLITEGVGKNRLPGLPGPSRQYRAISKKTPGGTMLG